MFIFILIRVKSTPLTVCTKSCCTVFTCPCNSVHSVKNYHKLHCRIMFMCAASVEWQANSWLYICCCGNTTAPRQQTALPLFVVYVSMVLNPKCVLTLLPWWFSVMIICSVQLASFLHFRITRGHHLLIDRDTRESAF